MTGLLALVAEGIAPALVLVAPARAALEIVDDPRAITGKTVLEALGGARKILIHQFEPAGGLVGALPRPRPEQVGRPSVGG